MDAGTYEAKFLLPPEPSDKEQEYRVKIAEGKKC
jgi:hypothetical protein